MHYTIWIYEIVHIGNTLESSGLCEWVLARAPMSITFYTRPLSLNWWSLTLLRVSFVMYWTLSLPHSLFSTIAISLSIWNKSVFSCLLLFSLIFFLLLISLQDVTMLFHRLIFYYESLKAFSKSWQILSPICISPLFFSCSFLLLFSMWFYFDFVELIILHSIANCVRESF